MLWPASGLFQTVPGRVRRLRLTGIVSVVAQAPRTMMDNQSAAVERFGLPSIALLPCVVSLCASLLRLSCTRLEAELSVPRMYRAYTQRSSVTSVPHSNLPSSHLPCLPASLPGVWSLWNVSCWRQGKGGASSQLLEWSCRCEALYSPRAFVNGISW